MNVRAIPLGLQYIFTNGYCEIFARALAPLPMAADSTVVGIWTSDPSRLDGRTGSVLVHTALQLPAGDFLDAAGVRTFRGVCRAFGVDFTVTEVRPMPAHAPLTSMDQGLLDNSIRRLVMACGWGVELPRTSARATTNWRRADAAFERLGGMCASPLAVIETQIQRLSSRS